MEQSTSETSLRNIVSLPGASRAETVLGVTHIYRLEEQQTGGRLACLDLTVRPGHGVPPHTHHLEDELFYVIDGAVEITGDDLPAATRLEKGALFYGPRRRLHGFHNPTETPSHLLHEFLDLYHGRDHSGRVRLRGSAGSPKGHSAPLNK